ncbi:MAG: flavoprotein [Chlamydiia bacterium]|nr:flavoprotein [Chlamydiia bacterium]
MKTLRVMMLFGLCTFSSAYSEADNILIGLSGSISCYKTAELIAKLKNAGYHVRTIASNSALDFIGCSTLEGLTGYPVISSYSIKGDQMQQSELVKWADLFVLCPATSNLINDIAAGNDDGLLSATCLAYDFSERPLVIVPEMNAVPFLQDDITKLERLGVQVLPAATESSGMLLPCKEIFVALNTPKNGNKTAKR